MNEYIVSIAKIVQTFRSRVKPCPEPSDGVHTWVFHAACCAVDAGVPDEEAIVEIEALMTRDPKGAEIEDALAAARGERRPSSPRWSPRNPVAVAAIAAQCPSLIELVSFSPEKINFCGPSRTEEIIDSLFPNNPWLCVGRSTYHFNTMRREEWRGHLGDRSLIVPSPMSAERGRTKQGKLSHHTEENTGPRRFIIIEFDRGSLDQQAALLWHLATYAPLAMVVFSGSKSCHGWFFCAGQPEDKLQRFFDYAHSLGADDAMWSRFQFARLPDGRRSDAKIGDALKAVGIENVPAGRQAILYFKPEVIQ
jgi:hypothetical protein